jgi:hypothetical protein
MIRLPGRGKTYSIKTRDEREEKGSGPNLVRFSNLRLLTKGSRFS